VDGYVNVKACKEFAAEHRPEGWNAWLTFAISPKAPEATAPKPLQRKYWGHNGTNCRPARKYYLGQ
jgi:hypothetical protein